MNRIKGLYAIADSNWNPLPALPDLVEKFLQGGSKIVQLRMKGACPCDVQEIASEVMKYKKRFDFTFIVNDFWEVALEAGADGVHVGANDSPVEEIRRAAGGRLLIGYSSHSFEEAVSAEKSGADYVALGAIYPTMTKSPGHPVVGLETLCRVAGTLKVPVVAIGGINRKNFKEVFEAGASAAAMITALTKTDNIASEVCWFVENIKTRLNAEAAEFAEKKI
jgi:thiamine-phosphate pyrophosphorylase